MRTLLVLLIFASLVVACAPASPGLPAPGDPASTTVKGEGFAIYLTKGDTSPAQMPALGHIDIAEQPIIAMADIITYDAETHEITLTSGAYERISKLGIPVRGKPFVVCVDRKPIYWGAFWTPVSSISFDGITIRMPPTAQDAGVVKLELGYPSPSFYKGEDPRPNEEVMKSLAQAGKLKVEASLRASAPTTAPDLPSGAVPLPPAKPDAPAPGSAPTPGWLRTEQTEASDQGVILAFLRATVHEPRFIVLFLAISGPTSPGAFQTVPADLRVLDQTGREYPSKLTLIESASGVSIAALSVPAPDPAAALRLRTTEMRVEGPQSSEKRSLRGEWDLQPMKRSRLGTVYRDRLENVIGQECFHAAGVSVGSSFYSWCDATVKPTSAPVSSPPLRPAHPPNVTPVAAGATPPAGSVSPATPTPERSGMLSPGPTRTPTPVPAAPNSVPTLAPAATSTAPVATATPARGTGDFTDWQDGVFGVALTVSAPQPHHVYVLIEREDGAVQVVSEEQFEQARSRALSAMGVPPTAETSPRVVATPDVRIESSGVTVALPAPLSVVPGPSATPPAPKVLISPAEVTLADYRATVQLEVGQKFILRLSDDATYDWAVTIADEAILKRVGDKGQGIYEAVQPGQTTLIASGDPACLKVQPPCGMPSIGFQVRISLR